MTDREKELYEHLLCMPQEEFEAHVWIEDHALDSCDRRYERVGLLEFARDIKAEGAAR